MKINVGVDVVYIVRQILTSASVSHILGFTMVGGGCHTMNLEIFVVKIFS